ncbi:hypothetical protein PspLS_01618 [Pyricularia sp. CBS 133598]|nr:hypothetical protein PspLS_01618 [Pyricularia sp. CBS 133598]
MPIRPDKQSSPALKENHNLERKHEMAKTHHCSKPTLERLPPELLFTIIEYVLFSHTRSAPRGPTAEQAARFQNVSARCVWLPRLLGTSPREEQSTHTALLRTSRFLSACARRVLSCSKLRGQVDVDVMWVGTSGIWPTVLNPTACYRSINSSKKAATVEVLTASVRLFDDTAGLDWSFTGWGRFLPIPKGESAIRTAIEAVVGAFLRGRGLIDIVRPRNISRDHVNSSKKKDEKTMRVRRLVVDVQPPTAGQADRAVFCPPFAASGYYHGWGDFGDDEASWPKGWARPDDLASAEVRNLMWVLPWEGSKFRARIAAADKVANFLCRELLLRMKSGEGLGELGDGLEEVEFRVGGVLRRTVDV